MLLVSLFILITFELGHLIYQGKKRNGKWSLRGIVLYREHMPIRLYAYLVPLLTILAFIILILTSPLDTILIDMLSWLPKWFVMADTTQYVHYPKSSLIITFALALMLNGIVFPLIEEIYFRGYLMPRISRFGLWTPVIGHFLFTIYHFWQPYNYPTVFLGVLPLTLALWWKRNIRLGIITHCLLNIIGGLLTIGLVLGQIIKM